MTRCARYRVEHPEKVAAYKKWYRETHRDLRAEAQRCYRERHRARVAESKKRYKERYPDRVPEAHKRYRERHQARVAEAQRRYRERHPARLAETQKRCNEKRLERYQKHVANNEKKRTREKLNALGPLKLTISLTYYLKSPSGRTPVTTYVKAFCDSLESVDKNESPAENDSYSD